MFEAALDRPTRRRSSFVQSACASDPSLGRTVRGLLEAHRLADGFLDPPTAVDPATELAPLLPGRRIGAYRVVREIGRGGMGRVYLAERADEAYRKRVALKLVRPGTLDPELVHRLREERQILARLEHPNIARLLDGGSTEEGLPFLVIEHVEGEPIDRYCGRAGLSIEETIRLFREVCAAVYFAHQNLVVHGDLKPGNILVTGDGRVKLLDFGLARWTVEPEATAAGIQRLLPMTPEYASPEQIRGEALTTATDVYSLGVLLYELLTGYWPYRSPDGRPAQIESAILHREPIPPSAIVRAGGEADRERRRLGLRLAGDLDAILLTALAKRPADRYGSVEQLADDLRRHLEHRPVIVRPSRVRDRAARFARRNTALVAVSATAAAVLLAAVATLALQHGRLIRERDAAAAERERAVTVESFTVELFAQFDPVDGRPEYSRFREQMLDAGVRRVTAELRSQPEVCADLLTTIGVAYRRAALFDKASAVLRQALTLRRTALGRQRPEVAEIFHELGVLDAERNPRPATRALLRQALEMRRHLLGREHPEVADSLHALGALERALGNRRAAEALLREALAIRERRLGPDHPLVAESLEELGDLVFDEGDLDQAERLWQRLVAIHRHRFGEADPAIARGLEALGFIAADRGDNDAAEALYRDALRLRRRLLGDEHPEIARLLYQLAFLDERRGDYVRAERGYREVLAMNRRIFGDEHLDVAGSLNALARVLQARGDYAAAEAMLRRALEMNRRLAGDEHRHVAINLLFLAELEAELGDPAAAESLFRRSQDLMGRAFGDHHRLVARAAFGLADVLAATGRATEGEALARRALALLEEQLPADDWRVAEARSVLGGCLTELGRLDEAEPLVVESRRRIEAVAGPGSRAGRGAAARADRLSAARGRHAS